MKSAGIATGVALSIVVTFFALTCTGKSPSVHAPDKSPPVDVPSPNLPLRTIRDVPLSGGATRFDYQSFDPNTGRLYLAHLGDSSMVVFDADKQTFHFSRGESGHKGPSHICISGYNAVEISAGDLSAAGFLK